MARNRFRKEGRHRQGEGNSGRGLGDHSGLRVFDGYVVVFGENEGKREQEGKQKQKQNNNPNPRKDWWSHPLLLSGECVGCSTHLLSAVSPRYLLKILSVPLVA